MLHRSVAASHNPAVRGIFQSKPSYYVITNMFKGRSCHLSPIKVNSHQLWDSRMLFPTVATRGHQWRMKSGTVTRPLPIPGQVQVIGALAGEP